MYSCVRAYVNLISNGIMREQKPLLERTFIRVFTCYILLFRLYVQPKLYKQFRVKTIFYDRSTPYVG